MSAITAQIDVLWLVLSAALVILMQGGFCCLEIGLVRSKNSINVAMKNLVDLCVAVAAFWLFGFALMYGDSAGGWIGVSRFAFSGTDQPGLLAFFLLHTMICGIVATILAGAVAERMRFHAYILISFAIAGFIYPVVGHWVWNGVDSGVTGGWLAKIGFIDFAGATVVHSVAGWVALAALIHIGPRRGRFGPDGHPIRGSNVPMATLGTLLLWLGFLGLNGGNALGFGDDVPLILVNTVLGGAFGGVAAIGACFTVKGRITVNQVFNGTLAGLVAVSASCHATQVAGAVTIGAIGGMLSFLAVRLLEDRNIDDVVGVVPVHLVGGVWGTIAVALFADPVLLGSESGMVEQFLIQLIGVGAAFAWAFGGGYLCIWLASRFVRLRVTDEEERIGLNIIEHGTTTEALDLLREMERHRVVGNFENVPVEPHTEVGQIARLYNLVLDRVRQDRSELLAANERISHVNVALGEARDAEVTSRKELQSTVQELEKFNKLAVGRELRMVELKKEVNDLATELGREGQYDLSFVEESDEESAVDNGDATESTAVEDCKAPGGEGDDEETTRDATVESSGA